MRKSSEGTIGRTPKMARYCIRRQDEPSLPEIFAEPIIQAVMARAGTSKLEMEGLLRAVRSRLVRRQAEAAERAG
jgi:hypothetical protein